MTTRKTRQSLGVTVAALAGLGGLLLLGTGCATAGPLHLYALPATGRERPVSDLGAERATEVPSFLESGDVVSGFAYDPFTDHFFLRLDPGNKIKVVDRPARAIKREFEIDGATGKGDLAVRPRDGHLFLLAGGDGLIETSRLGKVIRTFSLSGATGPFIGIAVDTVRDQLLLLAQDGRRVTRHDLEGRTIGEVNLAQPAGASLAFDSEKREFYAPLRDRANETGVFEESGALRRTQKASGSFVDVGVRSFVRVF